MLSERILTALEVLGSDEQVTGTLRDQAATYLGEEVDDLALKFLLRTSVVLYDEGRAASLRYEPHNTAGAHDVGLTMLAVAAMAIGKRLGIEDGERFAREVPNVD